jgi:transcriptional regulator with XRE-family HTH domain
MARAGLSWTVNDLAEKANVRPATISGFERGGDSKSSTINALENAFLSTNLVTFDGKNGVFVLDEQPDAPSTGGIDRLPMGESTVD